MGGKCAEVNARIPNPICQESQKQKMYNERQKESTILHPFIIAIFQKLQASFKHLVRRHESGKIQEHEI